ncbi:hypothetical protein KJ848_03235 [Patescibacteria group bacterium]|nr:hypothetical protein [Patescibacteria group bacterium]MBU2159171.1 hypothetical protein [Patescibacteria group bacterium]
MNDPFGISFEKTSFKTGHGLDQIRWGAFVGTDGKHRIAAFHVTALDSHFAHEGGKDIEEEANLTVASGAALSGATHQAYEWVNNRFESVDVDDQTWFKFVV